MEGFNQIVSVADVLNGDAEYDYREMNVVKPMIEIIEEALLATTCSEVQEFKKLLSPEQFREEFGTVKIKTRRQSGHTRVLTYLFNKYPRSYAAYRSHHFASRDLPRKDFGRIVVPDTAFEEPPEPIDMLLIDNPDTFTDHEIDKLYIRFRQAKLIIELH